MLNAKRRNAWNYEHRKYNRFLGKSMSFVEVIGRVILEEHAAVGIVKKE